MLKKRDLVHCQWCNFPNWALWKILTSYPSWTSSTVPFSWLGLNSGCGPFSLYQLPFSSGSWSSTNVQMYNNQGKNEGSATVAVQSYDFCRWHSCCNWIKERGNKLVMCNKYAPLIKADSTNASNGEVHSGSWYQYVWDFRSKCPWAGCCSTNVL